MSGATLQLWAHLYDSERGALAVWSTGGQAQGPNGPRTKYFDYPAQAKDAAEHARKESEAGREAYFCSHLLTARRRNKENAAPVRALWNEYDGAEVPNGSLKPTALVESSPGRYHAYWRLTDAIPPETAEDLNERIAQATGADPSGFDLSQLLRVPDTVNHKYQDLPVVRLVGIDNEHEYVPADLHNSLPEKKKEKFTKAGPVGERIPPGRRNKDLVSIAGTMRRRGMGEAEILAALKVANERRCSPPLEAEEVAKIAASVARYEPSEAGDVVNISANGHGNARPPERFNLTDLGNAERMVKRHGANLRYCYAFGKWLHFDGGRWQIDDQGYAARLAKETVRSIFTEAAHAQDDDVAKRLGKWATTSQSEGHIKAMLELAKSEPGVPIKPEALDARENLLNVLNGTIELRTGELREHRRENLLTKMAPVKYDPDARAPVWKEFLDRVQPDADLREFLQRATGYSATADTSEQCMFINYGLGANGKSTYQETISAALGDYAMRTPTETLLVKRAGGVPNDVARLKGARFVSASETEEGRRLAESLVKDLTGQDTISARFMRADWFDFKPTHKLWLSTNHRPEIRGTDNAIWRRIRLVPWAITIPKAEQDRRLSKKLHDELPGVLAWIVRGCLEWRRGGLAEPEGVTTATSEYRAEMDVLGAFFTDCCVVAPDAKVYARDLYKAYVWWCEENGERPETQRRFGGRLKERGFESRRGGSRGAALYDGVGLTEHARERDGSTLTLQKVPISRASDLTDPENTINGLKNTSHGELCKKGSEGSEGSAKPSQPDDLADLRERLEGDE